MATALQPLADLAQTRQAILTLAKNQRLIRNSLRKALKPPGQHPISVGEYTHALERHNADGRRIGWSEIDRFLNEGTTLTAERILRPMIAQLGLSPTILAEMLTALTGLSDRQRSMAGLGDDAINLACDIRQAYLTHGSQASEEAFASLFGDYQAVAANCIGPLWGSKAILQPLDLAVAANAVTDILTDPNFKNRVQDVVRQELEYRQKLAAELKGLTKKIRAEVDSWEAVAKVLGVSYSALNEAHQGRAGLDTHRKMLVNAQDYLKKAASEPTGNDKQTVPAPTPGPRPKSPGPIAASPTNLERLAGQTTERGTRAVLRPADFQPLILELDAATMAWIKRIYALCRISNNLLSQLSDSRQRAQVMVEFEEDFLETMISFQLLRSVAPREMVEVLDGMRQTWQNSKKK